MVAGRQGPATVSGTVAECDGQRLVVRLAHVPGAPGTVAGPDRSQRREHPRYPAGLIATVILPGTGARVAAEVTDLSLGGASVEIGPRLDAEEFDIELDWSGRRRVLHCLRVGEEETLKGCLVRVRFPGLDEDQREFLAGVLGSLRQYFEAAQEFLAYSKLGPNR